MVLLGQVVPEPVIRHRDPVVDRKLPLVPVPKVVICRVPRVEVAVFVDGVRGSVSEYIGIRESSPVFGVMLVLGASAVVGEVKRIRAYRRRDGGDFVSRGRGGDVAVLRYCSIAS